MANKVEETILINKLPANQLPNDWNDKDRLNVFFGPFRNRNVNSKDFDSKLDFWKKTICVYCTYTKMYSFKLNTLEKAFLTDGKSPTCLNVVIEEMYKNKDIVPIEEFSLKTSESWVGWAGDVFVKKPLFWSLNKLKNSISTPNLSEKTFVNIEALENESEQLLSTITHELNDKVIEMHEFINLYKYNKMQAKLLLHFLINKGKVCVKEVKNIENMEKEPIILIRFCDKKKLISDSDVDIYMLQKTEEMLMATLEKLENNVISLIADAKAYLLKGTKQTAKTCLRKKRDLEKRIESRANALNNVQVLLSRLEDASHNSEVLETYKSALTSLRSNFKDDKLSEELVTNTMLEIGEVLDIHEDIQASLSQPVTSNDDDLEAELEALLAADDDYHESANNSPKPSNSSPKSNDVLSPRSKKEMQDLDEQFKYLNLPDVPTNEPLPMTDKISL